jgi:hypothetical protein
VQTHVRILGVLFIALAGIGLLFALILMIGIGGAASIVSASDTEEAALAVPIIGIAGATLVMLLLALSLPGLVTGIGLLYFKPWARIAGIVLSALSLLGFPIGTVVGGYGLWVLLSKETEPFFPPGVPR